MARRHGAGGMGARARGKRALGRWARRASGRAGRWARAAGAHGRAGTRCRRAARALGRQARGAQQARGARPAGRPGRDLGVQLGQWVVHLVHSACFDPV